MIFSEDKYIKLGSVVLPGLIKKFEIKGEAAIEEIDVEGSGVKPKQAIGYEDAKISIELRIYDTETETAIAKIETLRKLFKLDLQQKPQPMPIVSKETTASGITSVLIKNFNYYKVSEADCYVVTIELLEYTPMVITATKQLKPDSNMKLPDLNSDFKDYLQNGRGYAPRINKKTESSPAFNIGNGAR